MADASISVGLDRVLGKISNDFATTWTSGTSYAVNDIVIYQGQLWKCTTATSSATPVSGSSYWSTDNVASELKSLKTSVSDGKKSVASAITDAGVSTASDATYATMATNIGTVATNKYNAGVSATKVGTAGTAQVLTGYTFTNSSSVGASGSMARVTPAFDGGAATVKSISASATGTNVTISDTDTDPGTGVKIVASASATPTHAAVLYNGAKTGYIDISDNTQALAAADGTASSTTNTYYVTAVTVPKDKVFSVTTTADTALDTTSNLTITNNAYRQIAATNNANADTNITNGGRVDITQNGSASSHAGTVTVNAWSASSSGSLSGAQTVVSSGNWNTTTVTPSTSAQGPYYGKTSVNAVSLSGDADVANVLSGKTFYNTSLTKQTGTMATVTPAFDGGGATIKSISSSATGTNISITDTDTDPGTGVKIVASASATPTHAAVLYNGAKTGYLNVADNTQALAAADGTASSASNTYYVTAVTVPKQKKFSVTTEADTALHNSYYLDVTNNAYRYTEVTNEENGIFGLNNSGTAYVGTEGSAYSHTGTIIVSGFNGNSSTAENEQETIINNGEWVTNTVTPSTSTQGPYYGKTTVNAVSLSGSASTANVLSGSTFYNTSLTKQTGTMTNRGAVSVSYSPSSSAQSYTIPAGYHNGSGKVSFSAIKGTEDVARYTTTTLSTTRRDHSAITIGKYALFAGGISSSYLKTVVSYDESLTSGTADDLSVARYSIAAATVGNYALFAAGAYPNTYYGNVDAYNLSLTHSTPTAFASSYYAADVAAATIGGYALFAGGYNSSSYLTHVYTYDVSLTRSAAANLNVARTDSTITGASNKNYAIFLGNTSIDAYDASLTHSYADLSIDCGDCVGCTLGKYAVFFTKANSKLQVVAYDSYLTCTQGTSLSSWIQYGAATTLKNLALYGGGYNGSSTTYVSAIYAYNESLTYTTSASLSTGRYALAATTVGDYAIFAGGLTPSATVNTVDVFKKIITA